MVTEVSTPCKFFTWYETDEWNSDKDMALPAVRCGKPAEWRFGQEMDFCAEHFALVVVDMSPAAQKVLNVRTIR